MTLPERIHITGAAGAGTTSLGALIAERHGHGHVDSDDFFWLPTDPPYMHERSPDERLELLRAELASSERWVLSGSLVGWGDPLIPQFELVVILFVPTEVRLARLRARETARFGEDAIASGGPRHEVLQAFLEWASRYDDGDLDVRSRALHKEWLNKVPCPVVRLEGDVPVTQHLGTLEEMYASAV